MLFRLKDGSSGYLRHDDREGPGFSFQVFRVQGLVRLEGMTHVAGASSEERAHAALQHDQVPADQGPGRDVGSRHGRCHEGVPRGVRSGGRGPDPPFLIPPTRWVHGAAVT